VILITPESELGKELAKHERPANYNPDAPENQFPRMLYMANKRPDGVVSVNEISDAPFGGVTGASEGFNRTCQKIVKTEAECIKAMEQGWRKTQAEAIERHEAKSKSIADAAAHRAYEDRNMSEAAVAEAKAAEAETVEHVAEVPRKRGRPRKVA